MTNAHRVMHHRCCASPMRDCTPNIAQRASCTIRPRRSSASFISTGWNRPAHFPGCSTRYCAQQSAHWTQKMRIAVCALRAKQQGQHELHALSTAVGSTSSVAGKLSWLRNHNDTGGRTAQALPREAQETGQIRRQRITITTKRMVIIYPLYIEEGKEGAKTHKQSPRPGGTH